MKDSLSPDDYAANHYFAFVESIDEFNSLGDDNIDQSDEKITALLRDRTERGMTVPDRVLWLDCVQASYFLSLPWRNSPCEINNPTQATERRELIQRMSPSAFRVAFLLANLTHDLGSVEFTTIGQALWHRVRLGKEGELSVIVGMDFDLDGDTESLFFSYIGRCTDEERDSLNNVFNLNFIPDADLNGLPGAVPPPLTPAPLVGPGLSIDQLNMSGAPTQTASGYTYEQQRVMRDGQ